MENETKRTPTPWKLTEVKSVGRVRYNFYTVRNANRMSVLCRLNNKDIAQKIVRAVNAHDELLEALRVLVEHAQETYPHFESERGQVDIKNALNAIAKAEQGRI